MAIRIEIENTEVTERKGESKNTGKQYCIREQAALMFKDGSRYPDKIKVNVPDGKAAYPVGLYTLHDDSYQVSRFGSPELRPILVPVAAKAVA